MAAPYCAKNSGAQTRSKGQHRKVKPSARVQSAYQYQSGVRRVRQGLDFGFDLVHIGRFELAQRLVPTGVNVDMLEVFDALCDTARKQFGFVEHLAGDKPGGLHGDLVRVIEEAINLEISRGPKTGDGLRPLRVNNVSFRNANSGDSAMMHTKGACGLHDAAAVAEELDAGVIPRAVTFEALEGNAAFALKRGNGGIYNRIQLVLMRAKRKSFEMQVIRHCWRLNAIPAN
jgi:hypothetical protein